jgi:hypothetical protein
MKAANDNWPLVLTREQAAATCSVSVQTFDSWVRKGILPGSISGTRRWSRIAVERSLSGDSITSPIDVQHSAFEEWKLGHAN